MRAMILAAGLGTRLRPLTWVRPKALTPVMGMPLLDFWLWRLQEAGFEAVVINAFHLPEKLVQAVRSGDWPLPVEVHVEPTLLGTAGGMRNVLDFFDGEPFVVVNGDILCDVDLGSFCADHLKSGSPVSLLLHDFPAFNNVAVRNGFAVGFGDKARRLNQERSDVELLAFTGIHAVSPQVLNNLEPGHPNEIIPVYCDLINAGQPPRALIDRRLRWREIGSVQAYRAVHSELAALPEGVLAPLETGKNLCIHPDAEVSAGAELTGLVVIGRNSRVGQGARLENVIVWDGVTVREDSLLCDCIVTDGVEARGSHQNEILCERRG